MRHELPCLRERQLFMPKKATPTALREFWTRVQFCPPPWAIFLNPFFVVRRGLYLRIRRMAALANGRVMDFGAGSSPYRHLFNCAEYIAVDVETSGHPTGRKVATVYYDGRTLPFAPDHFDFVLAAEVLEHVFNIDEILAELNRVLRPGGRLLLTVPFVWGEHEQPHDFARYTTFGLRALMERHGFDVEDHAKTTGYLPTVCQMLVAYFSERKLLRRFKLLKLIATPILFAPILLSGIVLGALLPDDPVFYHNNVFLAKKR